MTEELKELFQMLKRHDCVHEATITTPQGFEYKLEWDASGCVVTQTNYYRIY